MAGRYATIAASVTLASTAGANAEANAKMAVPALRAVTVHANDWRSSTYGGVHASVDVASGVSEK